MEDKEKIKIYEDFLHAINMAVVCCNGKRIRELVENADSWSYAHRCGEGMSDEERQEWINKKTRNLLSSNVEVEHE